MGWKQELDKGVWKRRFKDLSPDVWLVFSALLVIALNLYFLFPVRLVLPFWLSGIGMMLVTIALIIIISGEAMVIVAHKKGAKLVTIGIYKYSRNPMYLGFVALFIGFGLGRDQFWFFVVGLIAPFVLHFFILPKEEAELAARFGKTWQDYAAKTPRWLTFTP